MKVKLAQVCSSISDGDHLPPPKCESGIPFVTISDIKNNKFDLSNTRFVPKAYFDTIDEKRRIRKGDVLYSVVGSYGIPVYADTDLEIAFQRHIAILKPSSTVDSRFLYYSVLSPAFYNAADNVAIGAAQKTITLSALRNLEIPLPQLPVQRHIADVLSAYDDLIENNRRRIAILEETARLTYRKWFGGHNISADGAVRFRHEVTKGGRGSVRAKTTTLGDVAEVLYGKDHKKIPDGAIPIFGSGGVMRYGATAIFDKPSVLIPRKGTIGNVMYVDEPFWTVDTMFYTRFKLPNMEKMLYYQLCDYNLAAMSTGAAVPSMTTAILNSLEIKVPPDDLRVEFDMAVEPMFVQKRLLKKQNAALATARDMLLPRLMKGGVA
ncbi:MAG: restriction endonuclease subunit S [Kiritimatiellae bacterium]|nr:restriction endonuclease subunit S [Kiritimatiellia bacterium]